MRGCRSGGSEIPLYYCLRGLLLLDVDRGAHHECPRRAWRPPKFGERFSGPRAPLSHAVVLPDHVEVQEPHDLHFGQDMFAEQGRKDLARLMDDEDREKCAGSTFRKNALARWLAGLPGYPASHSALVYPTEEEAEALRRQVDADQLHKNMVISGQERFYQQELSLSTSRLASPLVSQAVAAILACEKLQLIHGQERAHLQWLYTSKPLTVGQMCGSLPLWTLERMMKCMCMSCHIWQWRGTGGPFWPSRGKKMDISTSLSYRPW